jgi:hypothetical protein
MIVRAPETITKEIGDGINALILESDVLRANDDPRLLSLMDAAVKLQKADARVKFSVTIASCSTARLSLTCG